MTDVGSRVREARERVGLSARALDKKAEITPGHVTAIESGARQNPSAETLRKIAVALGVSLDWLVSGIESGPTLIDNDEPLRGRIID